MNEWSPGGTFLRPVTSNQQQQMRSFRSQWDDQNNEQNNAKPLIVNIRAVADTRSRATFQQRSQEDVSKTSLPIFNKAKKSINAPSDPRFKRVISSGAQNDACVGTEVNASRPLPPKDINEQAVLGSHAWNAVDLKARDQLPDPVQNNIDSMKNPYCDYVFESLNATAEDALPFDSVQEHLKGVDKFSFSHDNPPNPASKETVSDCTISTENTSMASEEMRDEYTERLQVFSSTTRVRKVQNWIADQKPRLGKKQSVITVIGQTQGQSALSSAFQEIDQRRKLVKELDRYAICNKITDSSKDKEINTLVAQINFLSPSGKLLYSGDKKYDLKDLPCKVKSVNVKSQEAGDRVSKHLELNYEDNLNCDNGLITEHDTSITQSSQHSSINLQKKSYLWEDKFDIRGKIRRTVSGIRYLWLAYFMIIISGLLCWYSYVVLQRNGFIFFDFYPQKPKTTTWYEKLCYWLWEIFRPSGVSILPDSNNIRRYVYS